MSYNAKNHFEQGGERFVVGGELAFEEGAGVTGFPSDAAFHILDLKDVDLSDIIDVGVDITSLFPVEVFSQAVTGDKPVLIKNAEVSGSIVNVLTSFTNGENLIVGICGLPKEDGSLISILSVSLCRVLDNIYIRGSENPDLENAIILGHGEDPS